MVTGQKPRQKAPGQKPLDNKPSRIIEEIIAKYAVDANLFRLGSTNPKKKNPAPGFFFLGFNTVGLLHIFFGGLYIDSFFYHIKNNDEAYGEVYEVYVLGYNVPVLSLVKCEEALYIHIM